MIQKTMPFFWTRNFNTIVPELKPIQVGFIKKARQVSQDRSLVQPSAGGPRTHHENKPAVTLSVSGGELGGKTGLDPRSSYLEGEP